MMEYQPQTLSAPYSHYVQALREGKLVYQYSKHASKAVFFPRVRCPYSGKDDLEWRISSGLGRVYSTSVIYPRKGSPYNVALIDLDEGFRMMSKVLAEDPHSVRIGQRVAFQVISESDLDDPIPVFNLMEDSK